jgi:K+-transporting ATPase KdpF subunit
MKAAILVVITEASDMNTSTGYLAGAVIALLVLGYLLYSLIRPEKF